MIKARAKLQAQILSMLWKIRHPLSTKAIQRKCYTKNGRKHNKTYYNKHKTQRKTNNAKRAKRKNDLARKNATNAYQRWTTGEELFIIRNTRLTAFEMAQLLKRSRTAISLKRQELKRKAVIYGDKIINAIKKEDAT